MSERLWFEQAFEGLYLHTLKNQISPRLFAELRDAGLELSGKLKPAYPAAVWAQGIRLTGRELFPGLTAEEREYRMGEIFSDGYASTVMGKALYGLLRMLGPRRTLPRIERNFRNVTNYLQVSVTQPLLDCFEVTFNEVDGIPHFYRGLMDHSGRVLGAPRPSSEKIRYGGGPLTLFYDLRATETSPFPRPSDLSGASSAGNAA